MEGRDDTDGPRRQIDQMILSSPTIFRKVEKPEPLDPCAADEKS